MDNPFEYLGIEELDETNSCEVDGEVGEESALSAGLELCDIIEYEKDGEKRYAYYIGDGTFYLLDSRARLEIDGDRLNRRVTPEESIDVKSVLSFQDIKSYKCKIIREKIEWKTLEEGEQVTAKQHDIIEVDHGFRIRHFAICSRNGYAIDLNPINRLYMIGWPPLSSCVRPTREGDNFGIETGEVPKFANGVIRERKLSDVIKKKRYRIRSDRILVDVRRSSKCKIYYLNPSDMDVICDRIRKAIKQEFTQYNFCLKNCEHFVMWIKFGVCLCSQTQRVKEKLFVDNE